MGKPPREKTKVRSSLLALLGSIALLLTMVGCAPSGTDWGAIARRAELTRKSCEAELANGNFKTRLAVERCANRTIRAEYAAFGFRDIDLIDAYFAKREAVAARLDSGTTTDLEARAEIASARSAEISEMESRQNGRTAAAAAILSTMPVTCTTFGAVTTCN
jgi:hypothetical protein